MKQEVKCHRIMDARHVTHLDNDVRLGPRLLMPSVLAKMHLDHNLLTVTGVSFLFVMNR
jgi:hypothetical protein